jgi:hypothetical protein
LIRGRSDLALPERDFLLRFLSRYESAGRLLRFLALDEGERGNRP